MLLGLALLALGCKDVATAPTGLSYSTNPAVYTVGTAIPTNSPTNGGGTIDSYTVSPALPAGLGLNAKSGVITGTPTASALLATYTVTGTNSAGSTTASLTITVNGPSLVITTQPVSQSINVGQTATFTVVASGTGTLSYQWSKGGVAITSATSASYTTPAAVTADNGASFTVQVADTFGGSVTSSAAILTVTVIAGPGTCIATGSMAGGRAFHTATLLANGKVLVVGGFDGASMGTAELYDPATGTFAATGSLNTPRENHTATLLGNGKVLIAGGVNFATTTTSAELYDPAAGTFTATGSLNAARSDHSATLLPDGTVLIVAGRNGSSAYAATAELYNPTAGTFTTTTSAPLVARATHTATLLGTGKVLIAGGFHASNLTTAELYDPTLGTFTATGNLTTARAYHTASLLPGGKVLVAGGTTSAVTELYDPTAGTFSATGNLITARSLYHIAAVLPSGQVLIAGGQGTGSPVPLLASTELYDPGTATWTAKGSMTNIRELHTATTLQDGKVLIAGGNGPSYLASAELYY